MEPLAERLASQFAITHGLGPIRFETDCLRLVQALFSSDVSRVYIVPQVLLFFSLHLLFWLTSFWRIVVEPLFIFD